MNIYAPLNKLKPIAENIWIVDGPPISFYSLPFTTRMIVIRLDCGGIFLHSPTQPEPGIVAEIAALGTVKHLVAPSWLHYAYLDGWAKLFPDAECYSAQGITKRAKKHKIPMPVCTGLTDVEPAGWAGQIKQLPVQGGSMFKEVLFFHTASKTMIFCDFFENIPKKTFPVWFRPIARMLGVIAPNGGMPRDMRLAFRNDRPALRKAVQTLISWGPEKIVFSHGDWYRSDGVNHLKKAFKWLL